MFFSKNDLDKYSTNDLAVIFSNIGINYMLEDEKEILAKSLDIKNYWEQLADKLGFPLIDIEWIPYLQTNIGTPGANGSCTKKMFEICQKKNITIGTLLNCLQEMNDQQTINFFKPLLINIMERYQRNFRGLNSTLIREKQIKILIQSIGCGGLWKLLRTITMCFKINGFLPVIVIDKLTNGDIDRWMKLVDFIVIVVTKNYKKDIEAGASCSNSDEFTHRHNYSVYSHDYICRHLHNMNQSGCDRSSYDMNMQTCHLAGDVTDYSVAGSSSIIKCDTTLQIDNEVEGLQNTAGNQTGLKRYLDISDSIVSEIVECQDFCTIKNRETNCTNTSQQKINAFRQICDATSNMSSSQETSILSSASSSLTDSSVNPSSQNRCNETCDTNNVPKKISFFKKMKLHLRHRSESYPLMHRSDEHKAQVVNLLVDGCDAQDLPTDFNRLKTFQWPHEFNKLHLHLKNAAPH